MIFYSDSRDISKLEYLGCHLIESANIGYKKGDLMCRTKWPTGWVLESDDQFDLYCKMMYGFAPCMITEEEYWEFDTNGIVFFSSPRFSIIRKSIESRRLNHTIPYCI